MLDSFLQVGYEATVKQASVDLRTRLEKVAGSLGSDNRRIAPSTTADTIHVENAQGAGALGDAACTGDDHLQNVSEGLQVSKTASQLAIDEKLEVALAKVAAAVAVGSALAKNAADLTQPAREHIKPKNFAIPKGDGPGDTGKYPIHDKRHAENALARVDQHGTPSEKAKVHSAVAKKYPELAARSSVPDVAKKGERNLEKNAFLGALAKSVPGMLSGAKGLASGAGSLARTSYAAGGVPQVAKSFGNVAKQFAQKNPLAAAGIAAGGGLLAGKALSGNGQ